jgi:hypothetical protein
MFIGGAMRLANLTFTGLLYACLAFTSSQAAADAGVFTGNGQNLRQISSKSIQLVNIDVSIVPGRGPFLFDGTVRGMDEVRYECKFVLRNLTGKAEDVQVGFPVDSQFAQEAEPKASAEPDLNWVLEYGFIALDEKSTYRVEFVRRKPGKGPNEFGAIFVWNMNFAPHETKTLQVHYHIPMSMGLVSTERNDNASSVAPTGSFSQELLVIAYLELAGYITSTGSSWAGNVERATFRAYTQPFEKYINRRGITEENKSDMSSEDAERFESGFPVLHPWWFREIKPAGWKPIEGGIQWEYQNFKPEEAITISYYQTQLPRSADEVNAFIDRFLKGVQAGESIVNDLMSVRELLLATYGKEPENPAVRAFASEQRWYAPRKNFSMADLQPDQRAVLDSLSKRIAIAQQTK